MWGTAVASSNRVGSLVVLYDGYETKGEAEQKSTKEAEKDNEEETTIAKTISFSPH